MDDVHEICVDNMAFYHLMKMIWYKLSQILLLQVDGYRNNLGGIWFVSTYLVHDHRNLISIRILLLEAITRIGP